MKTEAAGVGDERSERSSGMAGSGWLREGLWLAGKEIRRSWLSYPASGLGMLLLGVILTPAIDDLLSLEGFGEGGHFGEFEPPFFMDLLFLWFGMLLAVNWISREYLVFSPGAFLERLTERLIFMRSLPVSPGTLIGSRMISLCFALLFNVPAFFIPMYLLSDLGHLGWSFAWFVLIWVGYSLLGAGLWLLGEFGIRGRKTYFWLPTLQGGLPIIAAIVFLELTVKLSVVGRIADLAQSNGPLVAIVSLIVGAVGLALMARAATRRFERRDLSA